MSGGSQRPTVLILAHQPMRAGFVFDVKAPVQGIAQRPGDMAFSYDESFGEV